MENTKVDISVEESYKVPNLEKGIAVLELLSFVGAGMTLQEIKVELEISQTTAYRILNTLVRRGYLLYNETSKKYRLSRKMLTVGFRAVQEHNLLEVVLPRLRQVRDKVKETVCFGVLGAEKALFIEQALGTHPFCFFPAPKTGYPKSPLLCMPDVSCRPQKRFRLKWDIREIKFDTVKINRS